MSKKCTNCNETYLKPEKHFNKDKSRKDGLSFYCRNCNREITQWYEDKKKKPLITVTCGYSKCNNTFQTRHYHKKYCCSSHASLHYQEDKIGKDVIRFRAAFRRKLKRRIEDKPNTNKTWTEKEKNILIKLKEKGIAYKEIAERLGRGRDACSKKFHELKHRKSV